MTDTTTIPERFFVMKQELNELCSARSEADLSELTVQLAELRAEVDRLHKKVARRAIRPGSKVAFTTRGGRHVETTVEKINSKTCTCAPCPEYPRGVRVPLAMLEVL